MEYSAFDHRHEFSAWAAARAVQRRFLNGSSTLLREAIDQCGVREVLSAPNWPATVEVVDDLHRTWCRSMLVFWHRRRLTATYGRAAKLLGVYLKSMVVIGPDHETPFARLAHPPIDRILLRSLSRSAAYSAEHRRLWRLTDWTHLDEVKYFALVASFRTEGLDRPAFWHLERFWKPSKAATEQ